MLASKPPPPAVKPSEEVTFGFFNPITPSSLSNGNNNVVKSESTLSIHQPPISRPALVSSVSGSMGPPTHSFLPPPAMLNTIALSSSSPKGPPLPMGGLLDRGGNAHGNTAVCFFFFEKLIWKITFSFSENFYNILILQKHLREGVDLRSF